MSALRTAAVLGLLVALEAPALAATGAERDVSSTTQRIAELEWSRGSPLLLASQVPGSDAADRAEIARSLGRLRSADALDVLLGLLDDPEREVRVAAAEALGRTPGSVPHLRQRLAVEPLPRTPAERAAAASGLAVALIGALGDAGGADELGILASLLQEPWPVGSAAAVALGRMANRPGVSVGPEIASAVVARLDASDPRLVADAAWALSRLGRPSLPPAEVEAVVRRIRGGSYETARAWLVKAVWPSLPQERRGELFVEMATDPSRLVRVAVLVALRDGDVAAEVVAAWLADPDPWVRHSAIAALGRIRSDASRLALTEHARRTDDPYEQAAAIHAVGDEDPVAAADRSLPPVVQAAHVAALSDPERLIAIATDPEAEPIVRSAAAGALLELEGVDGALGERLLASRDAAVREAGIELVSKLPPAGVVRLLGVHLRVETDGDVLAAGLSQLATALGADPKAAAQLSEGSAIVARTAIRSEPRVRAGALAVAAALRIEAPAAIEPTGRRELVLPSGSVVEVARGRPALETVDRIRGARVETSEGTFVLSLDPEVAPLAVHNFAALADAGYFDGMVFHRVIPGFVAQTGCPRGDGWGGPGYAIPDEVSSIPYSAGSLGMARADRDTGGSQWFVTTGDQPHLAGEYTRFGEVVDGMYVVKRLRPGSRLIHVTIERLPVAGAADR